MKARSSNPRRIYRVEHVDNVVARAVFSRPKQSPLRLEDCFDVALLLLAMTGTRRKQKAPRIFGAQNQDSVKPESTNKNPENKVCFRDSQIRLALSLYPSSIQTITVGPGVTPSPALARSRAVPPIGNYTLPRRLIFS